jgi:catechol 2,3-dioxygenase-like lactoylglutathione lyase family enzyme
MADGGWRMADGETAYSIRGAGGHSLFTIHAFGGEMLKFNHLHLKTRDPDKTVQFYVDTFGAKILNKNAQGGYRIDLQGLELNVSKFLDQKREQKYGMEHIAIDTDELDALVEKLKGQGIHILEQTVVSGGRRVCFFEGPDGVQLEFIEMKK